LRFGALWGLPSRSIHRATWIAPRRTPQCGFLDQRFEPRAAEQAARHTIVSVLLDICGVYVLIRYSGLAHPARMATLKQKIQAETRVRQFLRDGGLPDPDGVEYGYGCIRLFFNEPKVCLVVDIDNPEEDGERGAAGGAREAGEVWEEDRSLYDAEEDQEYDRGYPLEPWEPDDAELN
jgi:hypothetical protein